MLALVEALTHEYDLVDINVIFLSVRKHVIGDSYTIIESSWVGVLWS